MTDWNKGRWKRRLFAEEMMIGSTLMGRAEEGSYRNCYIGTGTGTFSLLNY